MRISTLSLLALPLLATAQDFQDTPLTQAKLQAQSWLRKLQSYIPTTTTDSPPLTSSTKDLPPAEVPHLTLTNWRSVLNSSSSLTSSTSSPQEWWVLTTGGNKTCFGLCNQVEKSFNESASLFALDRTAPHMALLNCDSEPVLCNSWGAGPPHLWTMEIGEPGTPVPIITLPLNTSSTTVQTFVDLHATKSYKEKKPYEGWFHPFDGELAKYGAAVPVGYVLWFFAVIPSWMFMIGVSFLSRTIMSKRTLGPQRPAADAAATPPRAAPAGDGTVY